MNKVITVNLGGMAYSVEEGGYDALRGYLETAGARLQGNPDREEILSDIERAIGEKFRALLGSHKTVIETKEVAAVMAELGPIEVEGAEGADAGAGRGATAGASGAGTSGQAGASSSGGASRRLYRIHEGSMIAGVCNGIGAYLNIDPTLVRLGFVLLTVFGGAGVVVYLVMALVVPEARSPEEKAAATGATGFPETAQEFIRRAKEGYYEAMRNFPDRKARREWKRRLRREMRAHADQWRYDWHAYWMQNAPVHPGIGFALPLFSLLHGAVTVLWLCALISLLATGGLFGQALPANVPVWVAALVLLIAYAVITAPLKMARRACYWGLGRARWLFSFVHLVDAVIWVAVVIALLWLAIHFSPELRDALHSVPAVAHEAANDMRTWSVNF